MEPSQSLTHPSRWPVPLIYMAFVGLSRGTLKKMGGGVPKGGPGKFSWRIARLDGPRPHGSYVLKSNSPEGWYTIR